MKEDVNDQLETAKDDHLESAPPVDLPQPNSAAPAPDIAESAADLVSPPTAALTAEELETLKAQAAKAAEHWDRLLRVSADFENFRKRSQRERQDAVKYANEGLLEKLLPVLDHFEMALAAAQSAAPGNLDSFKTGIQIIYSQLKTVLREAGLEEVDATGQVFDPTSHEALSQEESAEAPEGQVLRQVRRGYRLRDRLLRPASVVVARKPAS